uniref:bile acid:sodium symporter n=1 Tax=Parerythrobacter lutipelagi TaxID=1964208 RepID=UPI0010F75B94|nr:bile acid:sodium symporter [Parerythrobacter lutipelagi]
MSRIASLFDPMVKLLLLAILLAFLVPAIDRTLEIARAVSNGAIFLLFFVNGLRIDRREIVRSFARLGFFLPLLLWVFVAMALVGLGFAKLASGVLPPMVALGFLFLGTLPSTIQSATSYTIIAGGNVALSVVGAALVNIAGVFVTVPLFALLGGGVVANVGYETIIRIALLLVLPLLLGLSIQNRARNWIESRRSKLVWLDRVVIAIAVYVAFSGAVDQGIATQVTAIGWAWLFALVLLFLAVANFGSWMVGGLLQFPLADRIAFLFAASQKSVAIGAPLAALLFTPEVAGFIIAPLLLYHLVQLMLAAPLSTRLADRSLVQSHSSD